jgi:hypothetical protein
VRNCAGLYESFALSWLKSAVRLVALGMLLAVASCTGSDESHAPRIVPQASESPSATPTQTPGPMPGIVHFVPNSHAFWSDPANWTTGFGPAYADITVAPSNFLPCRGGPFALCYYSGPNSGPEDLSCT